MENKKLKDEKFSLLNDEEEEVENEELEEEEKLEKKEEKEKIEKEEEKEEKVEKKEEKEEEEEEKLEKKEEKEEEEEEEEKEEEEEEKEKEEEEEEEEEDLFPMGTEYEKELNLNFKYYNIFWFDPNKSKDFIYFKKSFENVQFKKAYDIESIVNFFKRESSLEEWIVITPGSKGEELISKIHENRLIKAFIVFCYKPKIHKNWVKNYKKIKCLTKDPIKLTKTFIDLNKNYLIPVFNYNEINNNNKIKIDFDLHFTNLKSDNKFSIKSILRENEDAIKSINKNVNKYNIFCMKTYHYLKKEDNCYEYFIKTIKNKDAKFYEYVINIKIEEKNRIKKIIKFVKNITLISLYFSQYEYLFQLLSYNEIYNLFKDKITPNTYMELYNSKVYDISERLYEKLMNNKSILNDKNDLKLIQIFAIIFSYYALAKFRFKDFIDFYQIINFYRDMDFSLKFLLYYIHLIFGKKNFINDLYSAFNTSDFRTARIFLSYANNKLLDEKKSPLNKEDQIIIDETLTIKDFIIVGDNNFHNKIKQIETQKINIKSIKYLKFDELSNYIKNKNNIDSQKESDNDRITFFYYLIIKNDEFHKNYDKILLLSAELGLTFIVIIYIENENEILFNKIPITMTIGLSIILVYSIEDIIKYLSKKINFDMMDDIEETLKNDEEYLEFLKIPIPKINFDINNHDDYKDGCFELAETFDANLINNKIFKILNDNLLGIETLSYNLYLTYKENNALNLFLKYNCIYLGCYLDPELIFLEISTIKRILYIYCRQEKEQSECFYYMINNDLRTRDPKKIYRYLDLIATINKLIDNKEIAYYKGKVYRATKFDEKLISKIKIGTTMVNTTFWSTTKDISIAEEFLKQHEWRNVLIYCKTIKNNIDIDFEKLNYYDEKEVFFLPFTEFKVVKIGKEKKFNRMVYTIHLSELGKKHSFNIDKMQIINVGDKDYMGFYEKKKDKNIEIKTNK